MTLFFLESIFQEVGSSFIRDTSDIVFEKRKHQFSAESDALWDVHSLAGAGLASTNHVSAPQREILMTPEDECLLKSFLWKQSESG